jgi:aspartate kinase
MNSRILKFNSRALGSAGSLRQASDIALQEAPRGAVILVSALHGCTEGIRDALSAASRGDLAGARSLLQDLVERHQAIGQDLGLLEAVRPVWEPLFQRLETLLEGIALVRELSPRTRDASRAVGDTLAAELFAKLLPQASKAEFKDLREVFRTDGRHGRARPELSAIFKAAKPWAAELRRGARIITQASLGQAPDGATTTLGRGGSDLIATLLGEALEVPEVQIWTDVDGILSVDPSLVPEARPIPALSLAEAAALSSFGAETLRAEALAPAARAGFRLVVANIHHPSAGRTAILREAPRRGAGEVTSVAYKEGVVAVRFPPEHRLEDLVESALRLEEAGCCRYGLLANPEGALLVLRPEGPAAEALLGELEGQGIRVERGWAVVALVGEGLRLDPSAPARLLAPLQGERLGAVLGGSSGASVAFLVPEQRLAELIPILHRCFILDGACTPQGA